MTPKEVSGKPIRAFVEAILIWHDKANSKPPPKAKPLMAAITGLEDCAIRSKTVFCPLRDNIFPC